MSEECKNCGHAIVKLRALSWDHFNEGGAEYDTPEKKKGELIKRTFICWGKNCKNMPKLTIIPKVLSEPVISKI